MNALLLLAALSSQITFNTTQQGDMYTIIPEVTLTQSCLCRVQILSLRRRQFRAKSDEARKDPSHCLLINPLL